MSETREPGYYWVRRKSGVPWEIVLVHPYDERYDKKSGQAVDSMGWDAGACLPSDAEWGSRILSPGEASQLQHPTHPGTCEDLEGALFSVEGVETVLVKGDVQDLRAVVVGGDRSLVRFTACQALPAGIRLRLHHTPSATTETL